MKKIIVFIVLFSFSSCKNYNSKEYIENENKALKEIILQLTEFDYMVKANKLDTTKLKLFISSKLFVGAYDFYNPEPYYENGNSEKSEKEKERSKRIIENEIKKYSKEKKKFKPFTKKSIKERKINYKIEYPNLKIEYVDENLEINKFKENEFGYLYISRIIFNKKFDTGYLTYSFFCGMGCAWSNNIEIKKINGKWKITETYSGGIA